MTTNETIERFGLTMGTETVGRMVSMTKMIDETVHTCRRDGLDVVGYGDTRTEAVRDFFKRLVPHIGR